MAFTLLSPSLIFLLSFCHMFVWCGSSVVLWCPSWIRLLGFTLTSRLIRRTRRGCNQCLHDLLQILVQDCINKHIKHLILQNNKLYLSFSLSALSSPFHLLPSPFYRNSLPQFQCKNESPDFWKRLGEFLSLYLTHFGAVVLFVLHQLPELLKLSWTAHQFQAGCYGRHTESV